MLFIHVPVVASASFLTPACTPTCVWKWPLFVFFFLLWFLIFLSFFFFLVLYSCVRCHLYLAPHCRMYVIHLLTCVYNCNFFFSFPIVVSKFSCSSLSVFFIFCFLLRSTLSLLPYEAHLLCVCLSVLFTSLFLVISLSNFHVPLTSVCLIAKGFLHNHGGAQNTY